MWTEVLHESGFLHPPSEDGVNMWFVRERAVQCDTNTCRLLLCLSRSPFRMISSSWLILAMYEFDTVLAKLGCSRLLLQYSLILARQLWRWCWGVQTCVLGGRGRCRRHRWTSCTLWLADHWCTSWRESVPVQILKVVRQHSILNDVPYGKNNKMTKKVSHYSTPSMKWWTVRVTHLNTESPLFNEQFNGIDRRPNMVELLIVSQQTWVSP